MKKFFLSNILDNTCSNIENIIAILKARGLLIDCIDGNYYLSDNACFEDIDYLKKGLKEYNLGELIDDNSYCLKSRRIWNEYSGGSSYTYKSIPPMKIKIVIYKSAEVENAINFFKCREQIGFGVSNPNESWKRFSIEEFGDKVPVIYLESYVAYYVKAISSCGVKTFYSCDGNHVGGGKIEVHSLYPSKIWHKAIWDYLVTKKFGNLVFIENGIYFNDSTQEAIYQKIQLIADFLYVNRFKIRQLKKESLKNITKKFINSHTSDEIERFYRAECKTILHDIDVKQW